MCVCVCACMRDRERECMCVSVCELTHNILSLDRQVAGDEK